MDRYNYPLSVTFSKTIATADSIVRAVSSLTSMVSLTLEGEPSLNSWLSLSTLTNMTQLKADNNPPLNLLRSLTNIKKLSLITSPSESDLTLLQHLESLSYNNYGNYIYYSGLDWVLRPSRLTSLDISARTDPNNRVRGLIAQCVNLKHLRYHIKSTNVTKFECTEKLTALESLIITPEIEIDLSQNLKLTLLDVQTTAFPKSINLLTRLKSLTLKQYYIGEHETITMLTSLEHVCCTTALFLELPPGLTSLDIFGEEHTERTHLQHLTNLKQLAFCGYLVADDIITTNLISLTALKIGIPDEMPWALSVLMNLKSLVCYDFEYHDEGPLWRSGVLDHLRQLEHLDYQSNFLGDECNMPPNLTSLCIRDIQPSGWADLAKMTNLQQLHLANVEANDTAMQHLTALTKLKKIYFNFSFSDRSKRSCYFLTALCNLQEILYRGSYKPELDDFVFFKLTLDERNQVWPYLYKIKEEKDIDDDEQ